MNVLRNNGVILLLAALLVTGCLTPPIDRRNDPPDRVNAIKRILLIPGEKLTYNIYAGVFTLGQATLTIKASETSKDIIHLGLFVNSTHSLLPSLSYSYESTVRKNDFSTLSFDMEETKKSEIEKTIMFRPDYKTKIGTYTVTKHGSAKKGKLNFDNTIYDYISILYLLRKSLPEIGQKIEVPLFHETQILNLKVKNLTKRDIILKKTGKFTAYILKPRRDFEGIFVPRGRVLLWLDTTYLIPLKIIIKLPFGIGRIELIQAENTQTGEVFIP